MRLGQLRNHVERAISQYGCECECIVNLWGPDEVKQVVANAGLAASKRMIQRVCEDICEWNTPTGGWNEETARLEREAHDWIFDFIAECNTDEGPGSAERVAARWHDGERRSRNIPMGWRSSKDGEIVCCECAVRGEAVDLSEPVNLLGYPDGITCCVCGESYCPNGGAA